MTLYIMVGASGSGKTTWIRNNLPEAVRVCQDDIYKMMNLKYKPEWQNLYHLTQEWLTQEGLFEGFDVVIDKMNLDKKSRNRWIVFGKKWTNEIVAVVMQISPEEARKRSIDKIVDEEAYAKMLANAKPVTMDEGFTDIIYV